VMRRTPKIPRPVEALGRRCPWEHENVAAGWRSWTKADVVVIEWFGKEWSRTRRWQVSAKGTAVGYGRTLAAADAACRRALRVTARRCLRIAERGRA
jgi:hypothetical protein